MQQHAVRRYTRHLLTLLHFALLIVSPALGRAQQTTGDVVGTISDPSGAAITGAHVTIENVGTHELRTGSTQAGSYAFTFLQPGQYTVHVDAQGFKIADIPPFSLTAGDRRRIDVKMQVGQQNETVQVSASSMLNTDTSTITQTIPERSIEDIPTNGRNFILLAQDLVAGANSGEPGSIATGIDPDDRRQTSALSVNGQNVQSNDNLIDGMDNNERIIGLIGVRPSLDAMAEFRVETNLYTADIGRTAGAVVNIITKSGTNHFHGTAFEYIQNDDLNAVNYFALNRPELRQNQFGGSLGGPIRRNKAFFFVDYEGLDIISGTTSTSQVPTLFEEQNPGNLTDIGGPIIPTASLNPIALKYFALFPAPNRPGTSGNFTYSPNQTQLAQTGDVRYDQHFNENNTAFARYTVNQTNTFKPGELPSVNGIDPGGNTYDFAGPSKQRQQNIQLNYVHIITPTLVTEFKAGYTRIDNISLPLNYGSNASTAFGINGADFSSTSSALTPLDIGPYAGLGDDAYEPLQDLDNTYQLNGTVTYSRGAQTFRVGAALIRRLFTNVQSSFPVGLFTFTGNDVQALTTFFEGTPYQVSRGNQIYPSQFRTWEPSAFFQDDWHVNRRLTLNLGIRYDLFTPFTERHGRISNFDPSLGELLVPGVNGVGPTAGVKTDYDNVAPRIGFSFQVTPHTVLRGGYGLTFFPEGYGTNVNMANAPFYYSYSPDPDTVGLSTPLPIPTLQSQSNPFGSLSGNVAPNQRMAEINQTSLGLEQSVGAYVIGARYVGDFGRHLMLGLNIDQPAPSPNVLTPTELQDERPYNSVLPNVTSIGEFITEGDSSYNALQVTGSRRMEHGLGVNINYTYAHQLDDISLSGGGDYGLLPNQVSTYDYGNSDIDIRHKVAGGVMYELPFGRSANGLRKELTGGWQLNALGRWQTGFPFTVVNGDPEINTGTGSDRPNQVGNPWQDIPAGKFFNPAAFAPQAFGTPGDARRNSLHGPHQRSVDISGFKDFNLTEKVGLQFRAEAFNVTNTPSFQVPSSDISNPSAIGTITGTTLNPRQLQFALKLVF